jgi:hypothetical protein
MSIEIMSRVWKLDLISSDKFILLAFADHADDSGFCYPSLHRIAWKCGLSKDTVRRCLARMVFKGIIQVLSRGDGRGNTTRYRLNPEKGSNLQSFVPKGSQLDDKGSHSATERVASSGVKGSTAMLPESSLEPSFESSEPSAFEIFWQAYPRKVGKPAAKKAWARVNVLSADVLDGLEHWKRSVQWQDTQFIPHPATFLNQRRWEDKEVNNGTNGSKHADLQRRTLEAARRTMGADDHAGFDGVRVALPRRTDRS